MSFKLVISSSAENDLFEAIIWYETKKRGLSFDFEYCIEPGIKQILNNPLLFQKRYNEIRINFTERFPFGIHYRLKENIIEIIGFFHTSRDPKDWV